MPSNRREWSRDIEGDLVEEFIAAAAPGVRVPGTARIAVRGFRTGTEEPTTAALTCCRPPLDGWSPKFGIS